MLDDLRAMAFFAVVARHGSFASAARELRVTRAAVSHQMRRLEERVGLPLMHRSTRRLSLTAAGEAFAQRCQAMMDEANAALSGAELLRREPRGRVRITCSHHFGQKRVIPVLVELRRTFPEIELDLLLTDANLDVVARGIDLAVRAGPLVDSRLRARRLLREPTLLCAAPAYLERRGTPRRVEDLSLHRFVLYPRTLRAITVGLGEEATKIAVHGDVRTNSATSRLAFVLAGDGLARLPAYDATPLLAAGHLVRVLPELELPPLEIFLVQPPKIGPTARLVADRLLAAVQGA